MGLKRVVDTVTPLIGIWQNADAETKKQLRKVFQNVAVEIRDEARAFAPVLKGFLEKSIKARTSIGLELKAEVYIQLSALNPSVLEREKYLDFIHYGNYNLGKRSAAKAAATGKEVGALFMDRAFDEKEEGLLAEIEGQILKGFF